MVHTVQIKILNRIDQTHKNSARKKKKKKKRSDFENLTGTVENWKSVQSLVKAKAI